MTRALQIPFNESLSLVFVWRSVAQSANSILLKGYSLKTQSHLRRHEFRCNLWRHSYVLPPLLLLLRRPSKTILWQIRVLDKFPVRTVMTPSKWKHSICSVPSVWNAPGAINTNIYGKDKINFPTIAHNYTLWSVLHTFKVFLRGLAIFKSLCFDKPASVHWWNTSENNKPSITKTFIWI